jgi:hypothetical protein
MRHLDLTGKRYGRLTVIRLAANPDGTYARWECVCECGRKVVVTSSYLRLGKTKSCGCLRAEKARSMGEDQARRRKAAQSAWRDLVEAMCRR